MSIQPLVTSRICTPATNTGWIDLSTGLSILTIDYNLTELIEKNVISFWCKIGEKFSTVAPKKINITVKRNVFFGVNLAY